MNRRVIVLSSIIGLISILGFVGVWAIFYFSSEKANEEGLEMGCKENIEQEFKGRIVEINKFEYDSFMHGKFFNIQIKIYDGLNQYIDYQYNLKPNEDILEFAKVGQKVSKIKGEDIFTLMDTNGLKKSFKIAKCKKDE